MAFKINAGFAALLLAGCATPHSEAPLATNFPTSQQQKIQAAAHWQVIATDVARQLSTDLKSRPVLYVNRDRHDSAFDRAFGNQLVSALLEQGFVVQKSPQGAFSVDFETQVVRFSANRPQYRHAGTPSALAAGVWALHKANATAGAVLAAGLVGADAYSWFRSEFATGGTPQTEILVTTSVSDANRYLARSTNVYYVADTDGRLYESSPATKVKQIGVTGK